MCIELANLILTSILSFLLIVSTVFIGIKQYLLQKRLSNTQNNLQANIANNNVKVSLYQNRINCYLQIMQALDIICGYNLHIIFDVLSNNDIRPALNNLFKAKELLFKSNVEAEALFDKNTFQFIKSIYDKSNHIYILFCQIFSTPSNEMIRKKEFAIPKIMELFPSILKNGISLDEPINDFISKANTISTSQEGKLILKEIFPESTEIDNILTELKILYQPNNELFNLIKNYVTMDNGVLLW